MTLRIPHAEKALACTSCRGALTSAHNAYTCSTCGKTFPVRDTQVIFDEYSAHDKEENLDGLVYKLKRYLKKQYPGLFFLAYKLINVRVGPQVETLIDALPAHAVVINIGAGAKPTDPRAFNIDFVAEPGIDLVANAYALPFKDQSVDMVIAESLFEHLEQPERSVAEAHRVLKPGGTLFVVTPFMLGFHSSPGDFYRWTIPGMQVLLGDFDMVHAGTQVGPTGALTAIMREWFGVLLSFNNKTLYQFWMLVFMILLTPLNVFDWVIGRFSVGTQIASEYYFIARKKE